MSIRWPERKKAWDKDTICPCRAKDLLQKEEEEKQ
jgi:hypothetical protein